MLVGTRRVTWWLRGRDAKVLFANASWPQGWSGVASGESQETVASTAVAASTALAVSALDPASATSRAAVLHASIVAATSALHHAFLFMARRESKAYAEREGPVVSQVPRSCPSTH